ncbi:MAG: 16S rRNA (cytidine(1402)-2'-O)-methyltransferase [Candidatus Omnitrophica bacterium]|nr:16S rRNA (cytidine(1402)-2'-O)-methyltransferase [Candidatus Omnitrophota bacterium]
MLYIVATPIGNLKDITLRALEILGSVELIACEDTRHTKILLEHYNIRKPLISFYQHNRIKRAEYLISLLKEGKDIALVSDAGTPGILDPGYNLINLAIKENIPLTVIPGPSAFVNALVVSGKPTHEFYFAGFLPRKKISRKNKIKELLNLKVTVVFYESCHRILSTLEDLKEVFQDKEIVLTRELTKKFEEIIRARPSEILEIFKKKKPLGEFVVVV